MKIFLIILGVIVAMALSLFFMYKGMYNRLVTLDEQTRQAFGQIETTLQRRNDLIPNLVSTVKGYAAHESKVFQDIAEARASVGKTTIDASKIIGNKEMMTKYANAQSTLGGALQKLLMVQERYPDLKANKQFLNLQHELAGTENRITVARQRYNDAVGAVNKARRQLITSIVAAQLGIEEQAYFKAEEKAQTVPAVAF
jgi:LemA protein